MPYKCCVPACRGNYDESNKVACFGFPADEALREKWVHAIQRKDFTVTKNSKVCEKHFKEGDVEFITSFYKEETGEFLTAKMKKPRLKEGAIPAIFPSCPSDSTSTKNARVVSSKFRKAKLPQKTDTGTESQNLTEPSITIKQEPAESTDEPPQLVIDNIRSVEELLPSTSSSSPSSSSPLFISSSPFPEDALANPDSTNVDETSETNKPERKRKIKNEKPDARDSASSAIQAKLHRLTKPPTSSQESSKQQHLPSGTRESAGRFISPTEDTQNVTREMFQSLMNDPKNNPLFGSRTRERPGDLFDVFADFIAEKLREMNWNNCASALRSILDIVFKAGQVQRSTEEDSDISNPGCSSSSPSVQE